MALVHDQRGRFIRAVEGEDATLRRMTRLGELDPMDAGALSMTLHRIVEATEDLLPATGGATVMLWDSTSRVFEVAATTVVSRPENSPNERLRRDGSVQRVFEYGRPVTVVDIRDSPARSTDLAVNCGIRAYAGVPIRTAERTIGALLAMDVHPRHFDPTDVAFLEVLAGQVAIAVENHRRTTALESERDRASMIGRVGNAMFAARSASAVLESAAQGLAVLGDAGVDAAIIDRETRAVVDHAGSGFLDGNPDVGLGRTLAGDAAKAATEQRTVVGAGGSRLLDATHGRPGPFVAVPMVCGGESIGLITVIRPPDAPSFTPAEVGLVEAIATQAAAAIDHVRMAGRTEKALAEVRTLLEMTRRLSSAEGIEEMLQTIVATVAAELPAHRAVLHLFDVDTEAVTHTVAGGAGASEVDLDVSCAELLEGLSGWVLRYDRPALSSGGSRDERESPAAAARRLAEGAGWIAVAPMKHGAKVFGTITAVNPGGGPEFNDHDLDMLAGMAGQAAVAIHDATMLAEVQRLAVTDALTGILTRGRLFDLAEHEVNGAKRYRRRLTAVMIDIDRFKDINDNHGHRVGDEVLVAVVSRCRSVLRSVDVFGRYGGEEFVIVLPETGIDGARLTAERLCRLIADDPVETSVGGLTVTMSIGVAELGPRMGNLQGLLDEADAALRLAKVSGRNRVEAR